jgi:alanine racemase
MTRSTARPLPTRGSIAEIDAAALVHNLQAAKRHAPSAEALCVVKADGYGHGAALCAPVLQNAGVRRFGVATVDEGVELREAGVTGTVLILGGACWWDDPARLLEHDLVPVLSSAEELRALDSFAVTRPDDRPVPVHLKVDTGMGRIGVPVGDDPARALQPFVDAARAAKRVRVVGVCTHFANADLADEAFNDRQRARFVEAVRALRAAQLPLKVAHLSNSAATLSLGALADELELPVWVRPGLMLYGYSPFGPRRFADELEPVLRWSAPVVARKRVPAGTPVSYGSTFVTDRETELAVLGVGYADGYRRGVSGRASVLFGGVRVPVRGRVCMDLMVADVTDLVARRGPEGCRLGARAVLLGADGDERITAWEVAHWADTIAYEILTGVGRRVPRILIET